MSSPNVAAAPVPVPAAAAASADVADVALLRIQAVGASWVEVVDGKGVSQVQRMLKPGDSLDFSASPPYSVVVGRADAVQVTVRGQSFDVMPLARNSVARFQVKYLGRDAAALDENLVTRARGALAHIEQALAADFLVGGRLSLADVALVAYTRLAPEGGLDLAGLPRLRAWIGRVEQALRINL